MSGIAWMVVHSQFLNRLPLQMNETVNIMSVQRERHHARIVGNSIANPFVWQTGMVTFEDRHITPWINACCLTLQIVPSYAPKIARQPLSFNIVADQGFKAGFVLPYQALRMY